MDTSQEFPSLGFGLGLRAPHYDEVLAGKHGVEWFEVISENFLGLEGAGSGRSLKRLEAVREDYPIALHGVSLSIGSSDPLDLAYLERLRQLADLIDAAWVSDHFCWTGIHGINTHDLLPLPYTRETVRHIVERVQQVQDVLGRRILLENASSYAEFSASEMSEWEFVSEVVNGADCGLLLDLNNIHVSAHNHGFDPLRYLDNIPHQRVGQIHLAGPTDHGTHLVDTHDHPVPERVWKLYQRALELVGKARGPVSTMVEWDENLPDFTTLVKELDKARSFAGAANAKAR